MERVVNQGLQFTIQIVLARILTPEEIGLMALVLIVLLFANLLIDSGLGTALVQTRELTVEGVSSVFFFNTFLALVLMGIVFTTAPAIARFYEKPELTRLIQVISFLIPIRGTGLIYSFVLIRELKFRKLFWITTPSIVVSGAISIFMAWWGFGIWALIAQALISNVLMNLLYIVHADRKWHPRWSLFHWKTLRKLLAFSLPLLGGRIYFQITQNLYGIIIGKAYSFGELGLFQRARSFHQLPTRTLNQILDRVLFPVFSSIQDDDERIRRGIRQAVSPIAFVMFGGMALLLVAANAIVLSLLTEKWIGTVPLVRVFAVVGMMMPLSAFARIVIRSKGHSVLLMNMSVFMNTLAILLLVVTVPISVYAIVVGQAIRAVIGLALNIYYLKRIVGYGARAFSVDILPPLLLATIAGLGASLPQWMTTWNCYTMLVSQIGIFVAIYWIGAKAFRLKAYHLASDRIREVLSRIAKRRSTIAANPS